MRFPAATHILCPFSPPKQPFHSHRMRSKAQKRILCPTAHHHPQNSQPKKAATGLRSSSTAASQRRWPQKGTRRRGNRLAAGKNPGEPAREAAEGRQRQERRARGREKPGRARGAGRRRRQGLKRRARGGKKPGRAHGDGHRGPPGAGTTGSQVNNYRGKGRKPGDAEAEQRPRCTVKPGMTQADAGRRRQTQADGRPAERVSPISA